MTRWAQAGGLGLLAALLPSSLWGQGTDLRGGGLFGVSCVQGYARAFGEINAAASALRLRLETAQAEVSRAFRDRPGRCEAGAYDYYLDQLLGFVTRALRSGATPQTPKEGWVRAAALLMDYAPQQVPCAEYPHDLERFQAMRQTLLSLVAEAGAGPLPSSLAVAFERAAPVTGACAPPPSAPATPARPAPPPASTAELPAASVPAELPPSPGMPPHVRFPRVPLPDWGVINLYEMRDQLRQGQEALARERLEQILRWIEQR
ncbi:MAG: hypothetical protein RMK29_21225 [Myxococcales bacterium]|nr:hypothetical protein [Myxococcota bacterium]MDW8284233.1 hypothetical protein [Myxococcales bacterium]